MSNYCKLILILIGLFCFSNQLFSQEHRCISESHLEHNDQLNKDYQKKIAQILANRDQQKSSDNLGLITIPVVVHILHNTTAQNISDAQVQSQIDVLNKAFDLEAPWITTFYPQATDVEIQFVLANVDPNGNTTTGITRTSTPVGIFSIDLEQPLDWQQNTHMKLDSQGGKNAWPTDEYLNIWVINCQYYIKGFGTFPGSIASHLDGVVVNYKYFGDIETGTTYVNYAEGKSCVHEVGHWLDLRHLFANNDCSINDGLADTPAQENFHYGCAAPITECGNTLMLENYMQYTYDQCQMVYTEDQKTVMRNNFLPGGFRESILTSPALQNNALSTIFGNFYHDMDEDEVIDPSEPLYSGVEISLYNCNNQLVSTIQSDNDGFYEFIDLTPGQYYMIVNKNTLPAGKGPNPIWLSPNGCSTIAGGNDYLQSFGLLNYGSMTGEAWEDMNGDGMKQSNEPSLSNATINLRRSNGGLIEQTNTFLNGSYQFTEVYPDNYYLEFNLNSDYNSTALGAATDNEVGNFNGANTTETYSINQGQSMNNITAGFFIMAKISGSIWEDDNFDGNFDINEDGANAVPVYLFDEQFMLVTNTTTNANGEYIFDEVYPGNYSLSIDPPNGTAIIPQPNQSNYFDQSNGPNTSPNFDFLSGYIMNDLNAGLGLGTVAIEDLKLSGQEETDHVSLSWSIITTDNIEKLELQRKTNQNWNSIFTSNNLIQFQYKDFEAELTTNYYRLVITDDQGHETISNIIAVEFRNIETLLMFQNPIEDKLYISFNNADFTKLRLHIFDSQKCLDQIDIYGSEINSNHQIEIDFNNYPAGMYFIQYEIGSFKAIEKLVKVH